MKKVFVSGCYDIVHAGHIQFFEEARALGDYLIVSFASEPVLWHHKQRKPSIPDEHKKVLLESLRMVDKVILGTGMRKGLDFEEEFLAEKPDILAVTEDDLYGAVRRNCARAWEPGTWFFPRRRPNSPPFPPPCWLTGSRRRPLYRSGWILPEDGWTFPATPEKTPMWSTAPSPRWFPSANGPMKSVPAWAAAARGPCWKGAIP